MPSAQGPREGIAAQWCSDIAKNILRCRVAPSTKPPYFPPGREMGRAPLTVKNPHCEPQASIQHTGEKGVHGGKSKVSPPCSMCSAFTKCIAYSHRLAKHNVQCRYCVRHRAAAKHEFPTPDAGWVSVPCSSASAEGWHCAMPILLAEK